MGPPLILPWSKTKHQNLGVTRLPTMEVNAEAADFFAAHLVIGIDETKKILSLGSGKEWGIQEFGDPIHLVRIGQVKGDLDIFVGVFNDDDAVIVDIGILPFAFEENNAAFLNFRRSKMCFLEKRDDIFKRQWFHICRRFLLFGRSRQKGAASETDGENQCETGFHFLATADLASVRSRLGTTKTGQDACRTTYSAVLPRRTWLNPVLPWVEITMRSALQSLACAQISCPA